MKCFSRIENTVPLKLKTFLFTIPKLFSVYFIGRASTHRSKETLKVVCDSKYHFYQEKANSVFCFLIKMAQRKKNYVFQLCNRKYNFIYFSKYWVFKNLLFNWMYIFIPEKYYLNTHTHTHTMFECKTTSGFQRWGWYICFK